MNDVIRLTRLAVVLQIVVNAAMVLSAHGPPRSSIQMLPLVLAITLPSLAVLLATVIVQRRAWSSARAVTGLLLGMILALIVEIFGATLISLAMASESSPPFFVPMQTLVLFLFIPALLGGWVHGRRGVIAWSAISIGALVISLLGSAWLSTQGMAQMLPAAMPREPRAIPLEPIVVQAVMLTIVCAFVGALADRQRAEHAQLEIANRQLTEQAQIREQLAVSHERLRLARELHDLLAHTMAGLLVQLRAIQSLVTANPEAARAELRIAEEAARQGLVETRNAISNLRSSQVQDLGLAVALRHTVEQFQQRTGVTVRFEQRGDSAGIPAQTAEALFLIAQEALRNIERHAAAAHVSVSLDAAGAECAGCTLTIQDDGVGFDMQAIGAHRFGLRGMEERAALIGARLQVFSRARQGTTITVAL